MTWIGLICLGMLGVSGVLCIVRIVRGPTILDRTVATDVFISTAAGGLGVEAAVSQHSATLPILVALALVGFLGSVSIARFVTSEDSRGGR